MAIATEEIAEGQTAKRLTLTREPKGPVRAGDQGSVGDRALMDAVYIILACWLLLFLLSYSLRGHNV